MTTATKKSDKSPAGVADQDGQVTQADEYRRQVSHQLSDAYRVLGRAQVRLDRCKSEQKAAKGDVESAQQEVNDLVSELRDIELGQYQPDLFEKNGASVEIEIEGDVAGALLNAVASLDDEGAGLTIESLSEFGLTAKKCEALRESKFEIKTVGDLERTIRENEWWHRDIKGFGETTIDKLTEALTEFRLTYPVPALSDDVHESNDGDMEIDEDDDVGTGDGLGDV